MDGYYLPAPEGLKERIGQKDKGMNGGTYGL